MVLFCVQKFPDPRNFLFPIYLQGSSRALNPRYAFSPIFFLFRPLRLSECCCSKQITARARESGGEIEISALSRISHKKDARKNPKEKRKPLAKFSAWESNSFFGTRFAHISVRNQCVGQEHNHPF